MRTVRAMVVASWAIALQTSCEKKAESAPAAIDTPLAAPVAAAAAAPVAAVEAEVDTPFTVPEGHYQIEYPERESFDPDSALAKAGLHEAGWIVFIVNDDQKPRRERALEVHSDSLDDAPLLAFADVRVMRHGGWMNTYVSPDPTVRGGLACVAEGELGIRTVGVYGSWAHVVYGFSTNGDVRLGWVHLVPGRTEYRDAITPLD